MDQKIIADIMTGLTTILTALIGYIVHKVVAYIESKEALAKQQLGDAKYNGFKLIAQEIFYMVEQQYKDVPNSANAKRMLFDQLLLAKIPGLKQEELDRLRESICGAINTELKK